MKHRIVWSKSLRNYYSGDDWPEDCVRVAEGVVAAGINNLEQGVMALASHLPPEKRAAGAPHRVTVISDVSEIVARNGKHFAERVVWVDVEAAA